MGFASKISLSCKTRLMTVFGLLLIVTTICSYFLTNKIIEYNMEKNIVIRENSKAYEFWLKPPASILRKYYLFDVLNPNDVQLRGEKPVLVQRGPYTYRETWEKKNVHFIDDGKLISFNPVITLHFVPELSIGPENDTVTFLNIPVVAMIETAMIKMPNNEGLINFILNTLGMSLFVKRTVGELISGYDDPIMKMAKVFMPNVIKEDKFSLMYGKNGTIWQNLTIMTGVDNVMDVGRVVSWNGKQKLDYWYSDYANLINGTDGSFYPPYRTRDQTLYSYNADMCRTYNLVYLKDNNFNDIDVYDYHLPRDIFTNSTANPNNIGFCDGPCLGNGVLNISKCYGGISGFISLPHFLNADQKFLDSIDGLVPNSSIHDFVIHFEPTTGVPLGGNIRLQISFHVPKSNEIELIKNIEPMLFPIFWFDDTLQLHEKNLNEFRKISLTLKIAHTSGIVVSSVGITIFFIGSFLLVLQRCKRQKPENSSKNVDKPVEAVSFLERDQGAQTQQPNQVP